MLLRPSEIRFCQDSIRNRFTQFPHRDKLIGETLDELVSGKLSVKDVRTISVMEFEKDGQWYSSDNRRLWVFQELEKLGKCDKINVEVIDYIPESKFTTKNSGKSIQIRGDPGGVTWNKQRITGCFDINRDYLRKNLSNKFETTRHSPFQYERFGVARVPSDSRMGWNGNSSYSTIHRYSNPLGYTDKQDYLAKFPFKTTTQSPFIGIGSNRQYEQFGIARASNDVHAIQKEKHRVVEQESDFIRSFSGMSLSSPSSSFTVRSHFKYPGLTDERESASTVPTEHRSRLSYVRPQTTKSVDGGSRMAHSLERTSNFELDQRVSAGSLYRNTSESKQLSHKHRETTPSAARCEHTETNYSRELTYGVARSRLSEPTPSVTRSRFPEPTPSVARNKLAEPTPRLAHNKFTESTPSVARNQFTEPNSTIRELNPYKIRFTKKTIPRQFDDGRSLYSCMSDLIMGRIKPRDIEPIQVYKVFGDNYWTTDGNRRLFVIKSLQKSLPEHADMRILARVRESKDEFLTLVRRGQPGLSLVDILQTGALAELESR